MTVSKDALIIRIPWGALSSRLKAGPKRRGLRLTAADVLRLVSEGRKAHAAGRTRAVKSLSELH